MKGHVDGVWALAFSPTAGASFDPEIVFVKSSCDAEAQMLKAQQQGCTWPLRESHIRTILSSPPLARTLADPVRVHGAGYRGIFGV